MGRFMITSTNVKKTKLRRSKLRRGLSAPIYQSHSESTNLGFSYSSGRTPLDSGEEDFEPLPHNEEDASSTIDYNEYNQRNVKKHKSNSSWSPFGNTIEDSAIADWLSSAFGGTENNYSEVLEEQSQ